MHCNAEEAFESLKKLGGYISEQYLPKEICPFIIGVLGTGQVGSGTLEALQTLPHKMLSLEDLRNGNYETLRDKIYIVMFRAEDIFVHKKNGAFDWKNYISDPENFRSNFVDTYIDKLSLIINGLYWEKRFPKIITKSQLKKCFYSKKMKLLGISDIACDIQGSIEILESYNSHQKPFIIYEPLQMISVNLVDDSSKDGIMFTAIPYLAASFSIDSSEYFSNLLLPYLDTLASSNYPLDDISSYDLPNEILKAIIVSKGEVVNFKYSIIYSHEAQEYGKLKRKVTLDLNFVTLKLVGHLIDTKAYHQISLLLLDNKLHFEVIYSKIGWDELDSSSVYLSIDKAGQEAIYDKCLEEIKKISEEKNISLKILD